MHAWQIAKPQGQDQQNGNCSPQQQHCEGVFFFLALLRLELGLINLTRPDPVNNPQKHPNPGGVTADYHDIRKVRAAQCAGLRA